MPIRGYLKRSELLDLSRLQYDGRYMKARIPSGMNRNKFSRVVLPRHTFEGTCQSSVCCISLCDPEAFSAKGTQHTQEVPAHAANHGVKNGCGDLGDERPVFGNGITDRI
jgi:hypothetical protein